MGENGIERVTFTAPEACMPEKTAFLEDYDGSFEQFKSYCKTQTTKKGCAKCGAKLKTKNGNVSCTISTPKKVKCKKVHSDFCEAIGCTYSKKRGNCTGKAKFDKN